MQLCICSACCFVHGMFTPRLYYDIKPLGALDVVSWVRNTSNVSIRSLAKKRYTMVCLRHLSVLLYTRKEKTNSAHRKHLLSAALVGQGIAVPWFGHRSKGTPISNSSGWCSRFHRFFCVIFFLLGFSYPVLWHFIWLPRLIWDYFGPCLTVFDYMICIALGHKIRTDKWTLDMLMSLGRMNDLIWRQQTANLYHTKLANMGLEDFFSKFRSHT